MKIVEKLMGKLPAYRKIKEDTEKSNAQSAYYSNVADSARKLRELNKGKEKAKTPADFNRINTKFNERPEVRKLKDTINTYKVRQKAGISQAKELKKTMPMKAPKSMPLNARKVIPLKKEAPQAPWEKKDYKPGSIMKGYTKYA